MSLLCTRGRHQAPRNDGQRGVKFGASDGSPCGPLCRCWVQPRARGDVAPHVAVSMRSAASGSVSVVRAGTSTPQAAARRPRCGGLGPREALLTGLSVGVTTARRGTSCLYGEQRSKDVGKAEARAPPRTEGEGLLPVDVTEEGPWGACSPVPRRPHGAQGLREDWGSCLRELLEHVAPNPAA